MTRVALLVAAALILAACAGGRAGSPPPGITGSWELVDGVPAPGTARATLVVEDTGLSGRSFCNSYTGTYRLDGDRLTVEGLGGTEMGCDPEVMAAEARFLDVLGAGGTVTRDGDELLITGTGTELRFGPVPPVPTSALVGTEWVLESLLDGDTASSTVGQPATLRLADDGTMNGSTGCRTLTGTWETTATRSCCRSSPPRASAPRTSGPRTTT